MAQQILQWVVVAFGLCTLLLGGLSVCVTPFVLAAAFAQEFEDRRGGGRDRSGHRRRTLWGLLGWAASTAALGAVLAWLLNRSLQSGESVPMLATLSAISIHCAACVLLVRWANATSATALGEGGRNEEAPPALEGAGGAEE